MNEWAYLALGTFCALVLSMIVTMVGLRQGMKMPAILLTNLGIAFLLTVVMVFS